MTLRLVLRYDWLMGFQVCTRPDSHWKLKEPAVGCAEVHYRMHLVLENANCSTICKAWLNVQEPLGVVTPPGGVGGDGPLWGGVMHLGATIDMCEQP